MSMCVDGRPGTCFLSGMMVGGTTAPAHGILPATPQRGSPNLQAWEQREGVMPTRTAPRKLCVCARDAERPESDGENVICPESAPSDFGFSRSTPLPPISVAPARSTPRNP